MMSGRLSQLRLGNYKTYSGLCSLDVRPLTLLYGYNSAGKSTALRFLKVLADSANGSSWEPLKLSSPALRGAPFDQLISKYTEKSEIVVGASFGDLNFDYTIRNFREQRKQVVTKIQLSWRKGQKPLTLHFQNFANGYNAGALYQGMEKVETYGRDPDDLSIRFDGLSSYADGMGAEQLPFSEINSALHEFAANFYWLSSHREKLERFELDSGSSKGIDETGLGISRMLHGTSDQTISKISKWYEASTGYGFRRSQILVGDMPGFRFSLHPNNDTKLDIDIADTGEGMGQVLPVIALLALASEHQLGMNPTLAFEHPELHIHPDAHVHLAYEFCDAIKSYSEPTIVVETHSENILLGLQLAIADGRISPSDVSLNWVSETADGTMLQRIHLDGMARPSSGSWPMKVFHENTELAKKLLKFRQGK